MEPFIGLVVAFAGNFAPRGWALCNGQLLAISSNSALFSILGTTYGGDGVSTFGLPELRGRVVMHEGSGPGLKPRKLGEKSGSENQTLTVNQLPSHNHAVNVLDSSALMTSPKDAYLAIPGTDRIYNTTADATMNAGMISRTGGGQPVSMVQPYLCLNYIIALEGLYPSRS